MCIVLYCIVLLSVQWQNSAGHSQLNAVAHKWVSNYFPCHFIQSSWVPIRAQRRLLPLWSKRTPADVLEPPTQIQNSLWTHSGDERHQVIDVPCCIVFEVLRATGSKILSLCLNVVQGNTPASCSSCDAVLFRPQHSFILPVGYEALWSVPGSIPTHGPFSSFFPSRHQLSYQ